MIRLINTTFGGEKYLLYYVTAFVVVSSFCYGLVQGFRQTANASISPHSESIFATVPSEESDYLPEGVKVVGLGTDTEVNTSKISLVHFFDNASVEDFMKRLTESWEKRGMQATTRASARRAVSVAYDRNAGKRFSMMVWQVPSIARKGTGGYPLQGMLAVSRVGQETKLIGAEVPGVPMMPGGTSGSVFSSEEYDGRSYTGSYSNPGTIEDNMLFYRSELRSAGWNNRKTFDTKLSGPALPLQMLEFVKESEEITLLFSAIEQEGNAGSMTLVTVVRAPKAPRTF